MKSEKPAIMATQSVTRALAILSCFTDEEPEQRVTDFVNKLHLTQSNVSRLLATMVLTGYVEKVESTGHYKLGKQIITLGGIALNNFDIRKNALAELYTLEKNVKLDANLAVCDDWEIYYLAHVDSYDSPRMYTFLGKRNPMYCTAIGRTILAHMDENEVEEWLHDQSLSKYTDKTVVDKDQLMKRLVEIRKQGYALEIEELALGRACVAAPIRDRTGRVIAGISVSGSISKIKWLQRQEEISGELIERADRVSMKMGAGPCL